MNERLAAKGFPLFREGLLIASSPRPHLTLGALPAPLGREPAEPEAGAVGVVEPGAFITGRGRGDVGGVRAAAQHSCDTDGVVIGVVIGVEQRLPVVGRIGRTASRRRP